MKLTALCILVLQIILFIAGSVVVLWGFGEIAAGGGGFVPGFESTQLCRLIALLVPYLALPISIVIAFVLYRNKKYSAAAWLPFALVGITLGAGQLYLKTVPDPIQENFGAHASPYPGFLVLPTKAIPAGFTETKHHYTKREYSISLTKLIDGKKIDLDITESDFTKFETNGEEQVQNFVHQGITGEVYVYHNQKTQETSFNLIWLNPPKQRIAIYLTQTPTQEYSPEDLIKILKSMKGV